MLFIVSFNKLVSVHLKATSGESFFIVNKPNDPIDTISIVRVYKLKPNVHQNNVLLSQIQDIHHTTNTPFTPV